MARKEEKKIVLEREYTVPLRKEWLKVPKYKRAKKAIKAIKQFIAKHMKIYDRNLDNIKIDKWLNEAIWSRGIKNPPHKIRVKAKKDSENLISVEFIGMPKKFKEDEKNIKKRQEIEKKKQEKREEKAKEKEKEKKKEEKPEKKPEEKEKTEMSEEEEKKKEEKKKKEKILHKEIQKVEHDITKVTKQKQEIRRMALEK